jgi:hypothetical protein
MSQSSPDIPVEPRPMPPSPDVPFEPAPIAPIKPTPSGVPLWIVLLISLLCLGIGLSVSLLTANKKEPPIVAVASSASSAEPTKPTPTPLELAEQGNPQAVDNLEKISPAERSIEQALALSQGQAAEKRLALTHLRSTISKLGGAPDAESTKRLVQFAKDPDTAREVIGLFATLPGPLGPDLLYEFANDKKTSSELAKLADQLLLNKEVRPKASPALALALDLRDATTCEARRPLLEKAAEIGDRRMLTLAVSFIKKTGCGDKGRDDCNPCLRDDNSKTLRTALAKVQGRKPPSY